MDDRKQDEVGDFLSPWFGEKRRFRKARLALTLVRTTEIAVSALH
jgi:hypothetical protein